MRHWVGVDWGSVEHTVCVLEVGGQIEAMFRVAHSAEGLRELIRRLLRHATADQIAIAIERPSGLLVDTLQEKGFRLVPIHPNAMKASRPRYSAAQGKSDGGDAYILADLLRTDGHRFRALQPLSDETRALRALVRTRDDLVAERVALANQLRSLLDTFWPGAAGLFSEIDCQIALAFLSRYPTPRLALKLGEKRLAAFLAAHHYPGRTPTCVLLERLRSAPETLAGDAESAAKGLLVRSLVAILQALVGEIQKVTTALEHALQHHPDGSLVTSLPRAGHVNAAQILAELGDDRSRFPCAEQLAAEAGVVPVTKASGKHRDVLFRRACNKRLRRALTCWADNSRHSSPWAAAVYDRARLRGCDHPHAVRILSRAWCRVLWRCWQQHTPYDPKRHHAALLLTQAA